VESSQRKRRLYRKARDTNSLVRTSASDLSILTKKEDPLITGRKGREFHFLTTKKKKKKKKKKNS